MRGLSEIGSVALLARSLSEVAHGSDRHFTGTSVVVCKEVDSLPYCQMTEGWPVRAEASLADNLVAMAHCDNPYHDGFHLLSAELEFLKVACYLAPRIPDDVPRMSFAGRGSRFSTAYFMSLLPQVICVGIVGHRRDVTVFRAGQIEIEQVSSANGACTACAEFSPHLGDHALNQAVASIKHSEGCNER